MVVLLACLTMIGPFTVDTPFPAFVAIAGEFGVDALVMQQTVSIYLLAVGLMSLFHGPVSDAVGRKPVILTGMLVFVAASVLCALAPSMGWLLAGRVVQGLSVGAGMIVGRTVVRDVIDGEAAQRAMSQISMIFGLAPAAAPIVGGWLVGVGSWRAIFWFLAGFGLLLVLLTAVMLRETHPPARRTPFRPGPLLHALLDAARDPDIGRLAAASALNFGALFTYISAAPAIVMDLLGLGPGDFGALFVPSVLAMVFGSYLTGRLAGRISAGRFLTLGFAVATVGGLAHLALLAGFGGPRLFSAIVGQSLTAFGIAVVFPILTLALLDRRPRNRGTVSSLQSVTNMLLNALVAGLIVPLVAHSMTLLALIALCLTLGAWGFWVWQDRVGSGTLAVPGDPETLEPTDRM